jgi:hypothetical protein
VDVTLYLRLIAIGLGIYWIVALVRTIRRPSDWAAAAPPNFPIQVTRNRYLLMSILGLVTAAGLFLIAPAIFATRG